MTGKGKLFSSWYNIRRKHKKLQLIPGKREGGRGLKRKVDEVEKGFRFIEINTHLSRDAVAARCQVFKKKMITIRFLRYP